MSGNTETVGIVQQHVGLPTDSAHLTSLDQPNMEERSVQTLCNKEDVNLWHVEPFLNVHQVSYYCSAHNIIFSYYHNYHLLLHHYTII